MLDAIMAETERARGAQRDGRWITYLIRDPRYADKRGNPGTPIYVGQTNDFPQRVLARFMTCEKAAIAKGADCVERRVADLLHLGIVATYQVLDYQPTRLTSLVSETNWARRCWNAGYDLANRAELQNAGGPAIGVSDVPFSWLRRFSIREAAADAIQIAISCRACGQVLDVPLAAVAEPERATITVSQVAAVWRSTACTFCHVVGQRRVRVRA